MKDVKIVVAGGSGFLGRKLVQRLRDAGHNTAVLSRRAKDGAIPWNPDGSAGSLAANLEGVDAVVNLAGAPLPDRRWTEHRKRELRDSRILSTRTLVRAMAECADPPRVFASGSAIGYYGPRGDEPVTESASAGTDFLARLCVEWEEEARIAESPRTRVALVRTGLALASDGGALEKMVLPFKLGLGSTFGSGDQFMSWIHADDWVSLVAWIIQDDRAAGAINATAPVPETNRAFTRTLGRVLNRPAVLPAPAFVLKAALGEMSTMVLTGQRVLPGHAEQSGFRFTHRELEPALRSLRL